LLSERHEREVVDSEIRRASLIQRKLLTQAPPEVPGYKVHAFQEQCRAVGGDLYDLALLPDGRLLFMVADVSGKGMGAALLMSHILASFRVLYDSSSFDLCAAVKRVSMQLFRHSAPEDFATLFLGMLDPRQDAITFCNAGHNPALLVRQGGDTEELGASGTMIGAFDFGEWNETTVQMFAGDMLFVYTDGVTEAEREEKQYGDERTKDVVTRCRHHPPEEIVRSIVDDIKSFVKDAPRSDDITMLLIKKDAPC
jgi:sigma-B regulation protein RsbU (phosphoserine phosphatase)